MDALGDQYELIRMEWGVLRERWFAGERVDPVFEGICRDFSVFDDALQDIYKKVQVFMKGVESLSGSLSALAECTISALSSVNDPQLRSDCCLMREAANQISRADAPNSAVAKLKRDMMYNIANPMRSHLNNNTHVKSLLEKRRRQVLELNIAQRDYDDCVNRTFNHYLHTRGVLEHKKKQFHEADREAFEWLYILEEYKGDILDSALQTLKHLQYEFFATAAHAISGALPARMEFRPMVEMTPDHLETQVNLELQEAEDDDPNEVNADFSVKLIGKLARENKNRPGDGLDSCAGAAPAAPVDPLSLSSLLSQGFEEGPARQALRKYQNDTQAALDYLIKAGSDEGDEEASRGDDVRMPTTVKKVMRLREKRRAEREKRSQQSQEEDRQGGRKIRAPSTLPQAPSQRDTGEGAASADTSAPPAPPADMMDVLGMDGQPAGASQAPSPPAMILDMGAPPASSAATRRAGDGAVAKAHLSTDLLDLM